MLRMLLGASKAHGNDMLEDLLLQPLDKVEDLYELNTRLGDEHYRKKNGNHIHVSMSTEVAIFCNQ